MEQTYIMLKPDAYEKKIYGEIIQIIEQNNLTIKNMKMMTMDQELVNQHYSHLIGKDFFDELSTFMQSGPVLAMIVEGESAIAKMRELMGPTRFDPIKSEGTIRGRFSDSTTRNVIHGSDGVETAKEEIIRFFGRKN